MNIVINKLSLDINKSGSQANIVAKEGDILSRAVLINFNKNGNVYNVEDGNTAIIRAKKPDGTVIYNNATVEDGKVYFLLTSQYCASVGKVLMEVQLLDSNNNVLYTPKFVLRVEDNLYNDSEIESTNEYTQLTQSINQAQAAITTAQALSLIKYVTALPTTGDSKYLYILYETEKLYELSGLPSQFTSVAEYNEWKNFYGDDAKACMFKTTDPDHPFILFYGIELEVETYNNPGMYTLKGIMSNIQAVEYVYNANTKQWVAEAPLTNLSVGDNIIKGESYTGSDSAWEGYYVIDDSFEATFAKLYGYLWCIGEFTMVNRLNTVTYTESDNLFNIYDSVDLPLPYGVPYVYDSDFNQYIEVTDADLKNRVIALESTVDNIEEDIVSINDAIDDINDDIESLELNKQDKLTAADGIDIINNTITTKDLFEVRYYKQSGSWKCDKTGQSILDAINTGKKLVVYVNENTSYTYSGTVFYNKGTTTGYNYLTIDFCNPNANGLTKFAISHYVPTGSGTETIEITKTIINTQKSLTAGDGISISGTTISTKDIFELTFTKSSNAWTCDKTSAEIKSAYNSNKKFIFYIINEGISKIMASGYYDITTPVSNVYILNAYLSTVDSAYINFYGISYTMPEGSSETISVTVTKKQYQDKLTAGENVDINNNVISAIDTKYTAGNGISITNKVINSNILVVTYTYNFTTTDCTCDKSYANILAAYNAGKTIIPILKQNNFDFIAYPGNFTYFDDSFNVEFIIPSTTETSGIKINEVTIYHNYDENENEDVINAGSINGYGEKYTEGDGIKIQNNIISTSEEIQDTIETNTMIGNASGSIASFNDGGANMPMKSLVVAIEPVQAGSGDPSPINERPITGWTECNVTRDGKNLLPKIQGGTSEGVTCTVRDDGSLKFTMTNPPNNHARFYSDYFLIKAGTYKTNGVPSGGLNNYVLFLENVTGSANVGSDLTITFEKDTVTRAIAQVYINGYANNIEMYPMLRKSTESATYEPYNGQTYNIQFPSEAGIVYGGTLDVTNRVLTVDKAIVDMGSLNYTYYKYGTLDGGYTDTLVSVIKKPTGSASVTKSICSKFKEVPEYNFDNASDNVYSINNYGRIKIHYDGVSTAQELKTAMDEVKLVYELATPITYNLTQTEVKTLLEINNIFADTGDIKECEYTRDATTIINEILAKIEVLQS